MNVDLVDKEFSFVRACVQLLIGDGRGINYQIHRLNIGKWILKVLIASILSK